MAYMPTNIIARRGYSGSGLGGWSDIWDTLKSGAKGGLDFYGQTQQQAGAAAAQAAQNAALTQALTGQNPAPLGISPTVLVLGAVGVVGLVLLLRK